MAEIECLKYGKVSEEYDWYQEWRLEDKAKHVCPNCGEEE